MGQRRRVDRDNPLRLYAFPFAPKVRVFKHGLHSLCLHLLPNLFGILVQAHEQRVGGPLRVDALEPPPSTAAEAEGRSQLGGLGLAECAGPHFEDVAAGGGSFSVEVDL